MYFIPVTHILKQPFQLICKGVYRLAYICSNAAGKTVVYRT